MDAVDSWVARCEWALGELLGQVYGEEYPAKYDLAFQNFSLQGGMGVGEVLLKVFQWGRETWHIIPKCT